MKLRSSSFSFTPTHAALVAAVLLLAMVIAAGSPRPAEAATGTFQFTAAAYNGSEGGTAVLTVTRSGGSDAAQVHYTVAAGTAEPSDYGGVSEGFVSFGGGDTTHNIVFNLSEDGDSDNETFTVTLDGGGSSPVVTIGATGAATVTILDNDGPPHFSIANFSVFENVGTAVVTVTRSGNTNAGQTVTFYTSNGSATAPGDYTAVADTVLTFGAGQTEKTVNVTIADDGTEEPDETVNLNLKNPSDSGTTDGGVLTILDDENGIFRFSSSTYSVTEDDISKSITVQRIEGSEGAVSVTCKTVGGGTASAGSDYTSTTQVLNWSDGDSTSKTCSIPIKEDTQVEGDETVNLELQSATGGALIGEPDEAVLSILDDEVASTVQFSMANYSVNEGAGTATITVTRTGSTAFTATVKYATSPNTAVAGTDYASTNGTLTFNPGDTSETFNVTIVDDGTLEANETINLTLSDPSSVTLGAQDTAILTILDNDGPQPVVTNINPTNGPSSGGTLVIITGDNFTGATAVAFGNTDAPSFTVNSDEQITVTTPPHAVGPVGVFVTNAAGTSSGAVTFTYTGGIPQVFSLSPAMGPIQGGTIVTITGTGFTGTTSVSFGGTAASHTVNSDTQITATAPPHALGTVDVRVTTPAGLSPNTAADNFQYTSAVTHTYTLHFRWSLIVWACENGISAMDALQGLESPDNPATNNVFNQVTAIFTWQNALQVWLGYFPVADVQNIPGANDFTTLTNGTAYWIAITGPSAISWTVAQG